MTIAALFVEKDGAYANLSGVEVWSKERDARLYEGPWTAVCHPPCQLWTNFAALNYKRYGGEHNKPGNDGGCFESALRSVRTWGGVLEHPAYSNAWKAFGLVSPHGHRGWKLASDEYDTGDAMPEYTCEVWQSAYGHKARKRTWLYYAGHADPPELDWSHPFGSHQVGWFDRIKPTLSKKEASATPPAFRDVLIQLARLAAPVAGRQG